MQNRENSFFSVSEQNTIAFLISKKRLTLEQVSHLRPGMLKVLKQTIHFSASDILHISDYQLAILKDETIITALVRRVITLNEALKITLDELELLKDGFIYKLISAKLIKLAEDSSNEPYLCLLSDLLHKEILIRNIPQEAKTALLNANVGNYAGNPDAVVKHIDAIRQIAIFSSSNPGRQLVKIPGVLDKIQNTFPNVQNYLVQCSKYSDRLLNEEIVSFVENQYQLDLILNADDEIMSHFAVLRHYPDCISLIQRKYISLENYLSLSDSFHARINSLYFLYIDNICSIEKSLSLTDQQVGNLTIFKNELFREYCSYSEVIALDCSSEIMDRFRNKNVKRYIRNGIFSINEIVNLSEFDYSVILRPSIFTSRDKIDFKIDVDSITSRSRLVVVRFDGDLSDKDLSGMYFRNLLFANLKNTDLSNATLENVDLADVDLSATKLRGANFIKVSFIHPKSSFNQITSTLDLLYSQINRHDDKELISVAIARDTYSKVNRLTRNQLVSHPVFQIGNEKNNIVHGVLNYFSKPNAPWKPTSSQDALLGRLGADIHPVSALKVKR